MRTILCILALMLTVRQSQPQTKLKVTEAPERNVTKGADLYQQYCAVCHGKDGKGSGPATAALKTTPADLTQLSKTHNGKFPVGMLRSVLGGGESTPAHGSADMPIWGPVFRAMNPNETVAKLRVDNLIHYLESLQAK